jgi:hypothetical protein
MHETVVFPGLIWDLSTDSFVMTPIVLESRRAVSGCRSLPSFRDGVESWNQVQ